MLSWMKQRAKNLHLRISEAEDKLFKAAAEHAGQTLSDFARLAIRKAAQDEMKRPTVEGDGT